MMLEFSSWTPDTPNFSKDGDIEARNVIPASKSYRPFASFGSFTDALGARCQGYIAGRRADGGLSVFAGDATKLYRLATATWSDVSGPAAPYAVPVDGQWSLIQFGPNIIGFNGVDNAQTFNIDTDSAFSNLGGSPPPALYACVAGDFVMTGNQASYRYRVQWSAINNSADWTPSQSTQSDYQDLPDGGVIQGMVGIQNAAVIFQEASIRLASYIGTPLIFQFSKISDTIGCAIPGSIAATRDYMFFYDHAGFYMLVGTSQFIPIGEQRVNQYFWNGPNRINTQYLYRCSAAVDQINSLYILSYPSQNSQDGTPDSQLVYNWAVDRWSHTDVSNTEVIFDGHTQHSFTLEELDSVAATLELLPYGLDSQYWVGIGLPAVVGFGTDHKFGYFAGPAMEAVATTTEEQITPGKQTFVRSVRPICDGGINNGTPVSTDITISLGTRDVISNDPTYSPAVAMDAFGRCNFRSKARYHRAVVTVPAGAVWDHLQGIDTLVAMPMGKR